MATLHETSLRELPPATPLTLGLWTTAAQAAHTLLEAGAGEALVLDGGRPLGVVTTRGLARVLIQNTDQAEHLAVRDLMAPVAVSPDTDFLPAALRHLLAAPSRRLAVVDATGRATGILAPFHVARLCIDLDELAERTVASAMARAVVTASIGEDMPRVLGRMVRAGVGGIVVTEDDRPRGLFTARDAVSLLAADQDIRERPVETMMRGPVTTISPQLSLAEAVNSMSGKSSGRLAVTDAAGFLVGLLTWTDVTITLSQALSEAENNQLREQAEYYRDLYDNANQGLFRLDLNGRPLAANQTLVRLLGYRDVPHLLQQARQTTHPLRLDVPERRELLVRALTQPDPVFFETRVYHQDGSSSRISCMLRAIRDRLDSPLWLEGVCAGLPTASSAISATTTPQDGGYRSIVEHQTELICRFDAEGRLIFVNAAFARYWGKTPEACLRENFRPEIPAEDDAVRTTRTASLSPHRPTTGFEHRVIRPDGRIRWQRWTLRAIFDASGELMEYQAVGRDITARKLTEQRLKTQYGLSRALLEALPLPVFFKDATGRYAGCNHAFEALVGLSRNQLIGRASLEILEPDDARMHRENDAALLAEGGRLIYEAQMPTPGGIRHCIVHKAALYDESATEEGAAGIVAVALDVTEQKQNEAAAASACEAVKKRLALQEATLQTATAQLTAETAERERVALELRRKTSFLDTVLSGIQDGISVLSPDLTVLTLNRSLRALCSGKDEFVGKKCHEVYHGFETPCQNCPALRALATRKLAISLVPTNTGDENTGWVELFCYPLFDDDGVVTGVVEIVHDVTAGKKLEEELAVALERAETASQAKGAFLANMSHEIRTPLNAVLGYVQLMLRDQLEPRQQERLAVVEESAATLLSIINDILDYSKIEAGRMEIKAESFDLRNCLDAVIKEQDVLARDKGLVLSLEAGPELPRIIRGDGLRLRQILRNLVNNAVKYTEKGSVVLRANLQGRCSAPGWGGDRVTLRFAVADTGAGIPAGQLATIFDSFTQVDAGLTKRQAGTGLGLAICRRLAGLMGGGVYVQSTPGKGSVFWLECPFDIAPTTTLNRTQESVPAPRGPLPQRLRILLVEDNRVNRIFASDLLESRGHEVLMAENGRAALEYLATATVDVVLMDIQMPVMDGLAATRAIRAGHLGIDPTVPIIGLSAYAMDQERKRFLAAGLDDYIIKPIEVEAFFAAVSRVLTLRGRTPAAGSDTVPARKTPPAIDTDSLFIQYRGKAGLLSRVGQEFVLSVPEQLDAFDAALRDGELSTCERVAHTLKGNAAMFGATAMRALAAETEIAAAAGDVEKIKKLAPALADVCRAAVAGLDTFLHRLGT